MLLFISLWSGCSLAPEYTRAPAPVPASWPQGQSERAPENAELISAISWAEFFPDERVQKISAVALENSRDLKLAVLNVERVRALYDIQRSDLYPAVSAVGEGMRQRQSADLVGSSDSRESE